jgi:hypothetical protein
MAALDNGLGEYTVFGRHFLTVGRAHPAQFGFVAIDHQQILHPGHSLLLGWIADIQSNGPRSKRHLQDNLL